MTDHSDEPEKGARFIAEQTKAMATNLLMCFFSTYGTHVEHRMRADPTFRQEMWDASVHMLETIASLYLAGNLKAFKTGIAGGIIANAPHDSAEIASLRLYAVQNMIPESSLSDPAFVQKLEWFVRKYKDGRGYEDFRQSHH